MELTLNSSIVGLVHLHLTPSGWKVSSSVSEFFGAFVLYLWLQDSRSRSQLEHRVFRGFFRKLWFNLISTSLSWIVMFGLFMALKQRFSADENTSVKYDIFLEFLLLSFHEFSLTQMLAPNTTLSSSLVDTDHCIAH